jgi:hypothetical protein
MARSPVRGHNDRDCFKLSSAYGRFFLAALFAALFLVDELIQTRLFGANATRSR